MASQKTHSNVVEALRATLIELQKRAPDDPALADLKASILRTIAELEVKKSP